MGVIERARQLRSQIEEVAATIPRRNRAELCRSVPKMVSRRRCVQHWSQNPLRRRAVQMLADAHIAERLGADRRSVSVSEGACWTGRY